MIDPEIDALLAAMVESGFALPEPLEPVSLRAMLDDPIPAPPVAIARTDVVIAAPDRALPARLYHAAPGQVLPVVLFFHGGGWVHGSLDTHDRLAAALALQAQCAVLSVGYRLAPENPFPAAWEDALLSFEWLKENHPRLGVDARHIILAGDSAGGNLAAAAAQALVGDASVAHQLLLYPALDSSCSTPSFGTQHPGFLSPTQMNWYWEQYANERRSDSKVSPAAGRIPQGLAPATIILAGNDPLYDEGAAYAAKLDAANIPVALHIYEGAVHGFISLFGLVAIADQAVSVASEALRMAFAQHD
jgi:acetyl esterase